MGRKTTYAFTFNLYSVLVPTLVTLTLLLALLETVSHLKWHLHNSMRPHSYTFKKYGS